VTDLEQLAEVIFSTAMKNYDRMIYEEEDPGARAMLVYNRDAAVVFARH
jgi:hypothetical protein